MEPELRRYVLAALALRDEDAQEERSLAEGLRADLVAVAGDKIFVVECKAATATEAAVAQVNLYRDLVQRQQPGREVIPVLVVRQAPERVRHLMNLVGGRIVEAPPRLLPPPSLPIGTVPLTADKAWKVITTLLRLGVAKSVRSLAEESKVSSGWVHRTVKELEARKIAESGGGGVRVTQPLKLLDIVAMERPFERLLTKTIATDFADSHEAAQTINRTLSRQREDVGPAHFAFGGLTAASLYTGYARRVDRVDLYVDDPDIEPYVASPGGGVQVRLYRPDRPITEGTKELQGVRVVSKDLALLDVAGLGFQNRDIARKLLESFSPVGSVEEFF